MGVTAKAAGAAMKVAAPEVAVAGKAAGAAKGAGAAKASKAARKPGPLRHQPNNLNQLPTDWHEEELDARKADAAWAAAERKAGRDPDRTSISGDDDTTQQPEPAASPPPASPGGGLPSIPMPAAATTGSGFLLGVFAWALGLAYLRGGSAEVKKFLNAKFLNKTGG